MPYIFGKLWHLAIIWAIRKAFQCILQGVRFLLANHTRLSPTSENESYTIESSTNMIFGSLLMKIYKLHMERQLYIWPGRPSGPKSVRGPWYKWSVGLLQWSDSDLLWANQHMLLLTSLHPSFSLPPRLGQDLLGKLPNFLLTGWVLSIHIWRKPSVRRACEKRTKPELEKFCIALGRTLDSWGT